MTINGPGAAGSSDITQVLAQMRALRSQASQASVQTQPTSLVDGPAPTNQVRPGGADFSSAFRSAIDSVNQLQKTSGTTTNDFVAGKHNDLVKVMLDGQKASIGFQAMVQARNRMVTAYQDIMNMPI